MISRYQQKSLKRFDRQELDFEGIRILFTDVQFGYLGVVSSATSLYFVVSWW